MTDITTLTETELNGLRRLLLYIEHDPDPALTAQLDAVDETIDILRRALYGEPADEREATDAECAAVAEWLASDTDRELTDSSNLGTRCIVSGGDVMELDAHLEAQYEDQYDEELPF